MTSRNRPGQNSLLANCMTQRQREKGKRDWREVERRTDGGRRGEAAGEHERSEGSDVKGRQNRTNLTHHDALNILNNRPLSPSDSDLYCAKKEKTQYSQLSIKVEFIIQLPAYCCREREREQLNIFAIQFRNKPSQYFLIKLFASSSESFHGWSVWSSARFCYECSRIWIKNLVYLVNVGVVDDTVHPAVSMYFTDSSYICPFFVKTLNSCGVRFIAGIAGAQTENIPALKQRKSA